jgi:hypothetical protein
MDNKERQKKIGTYLLIGLFAVVLGGNIYGIFHDFSEEYERTHKYGAPQWVYDEKTDKIRPYKEGDPYPELIFTDEDGRGYTGDELGHSMQSQNYTISGNKIVPLTPLDAEGMKIQQEQGCNPCHEKK